MAQSALPPHPVRLDGDVLLPTDGTVRSRTGSTHFAVGGTLDVLKADQGVVGLYADGSLLGVGAYYLDYKDSSVDGNKFGAGGKLLAGYDFPAGLFAEADYTLAPTVKGHNQDNVELLAGYRF